MKIYNYFNNIVEENISQEFRLKNIDEKRNYSFKEIEQNELRKILIFTALIDSNISHGKFVLINNVRKEYD